MVKLAVEDIMEMPDDELVYTLRAVARNDLTDRGDFGFVDHLTKDGSFASPRDTARISSHDTGNPERPEKCNARSPLRFSW